MIVEHHGRHHLRFKRIPEGYTRHEAKKCPFEHPDLVYVDVIVRTAEGLGFSGPIKAMFHDWNPDNHPDGLGAVVAYKVVEFGK